MSSFKIMVTPKFIYDENAVCLAQKHEEQHTSTHNSPVVAPHMSKKTLEKHRVLATRELIKDEVNHIMIDPYYKSKHVDRMVAIKTQQKQNLVKDFRRKVQYTDGTDKKTNSKFNYFIEKNKRTDYIQILEQRYQNQMAQTARYEQVNQRREQQMVDELKKRSINLIKWDIKRASDEIVKDNLKTFFKNKHRKAYFRCLITLHFGIKQLFLNH